MKIDYVTQEELEQANSLLDFIRESPSSYHAVQSTENVLIEHGFNQLNWEEKWKFAPQGRYYLKKNGTALLAFILGKDAPETTGFHIIGAHTDSPTFRLKPSPIIPVQNQYFKLNVETYGGPILNTWLDRPLGIAGRVITREDSTFKTKSLLFHTKEPLLTIPNLAIHMNRKINQGFELNKQKDLLPLLSMIKEGLEQESYFVHYLSENLNLRKEDILDFDLFLYEYENGSIVGMNHEFISASRLDDLAMVHAGVCALSQLQDNHATAVLACFDHEEVGSTSKQGAASPLLSQFLERIMLALGKDREEYFQALAHSYHISADMAHALHPNAAEKHDPVLKPILNKGPVIKISANQSYVTDAETSVLFELLCEKAQVSVQKFVNRSDERGGSTIGPISTTHLGIRGIDVGNPMLAMHSIRELGGVKDHLAMTKVFKEFFGLTK